MCKYNKIEIEDEIVSKKSKSPERRIKHIFSKEPNFELIFQQLTINTNTLNEISPIKNRTSYLLPDYIAKKENIKNKYNIDQKCLAVGGSSKIFKGKKGKEKFAIKQIKKGGIAKPEEIIKEVNISMSLHHQNIISFYEVYEDEQYVSLVMELGEEGDLFNFITSNDDGFIPSDLSIDLLIQICEVVDYLHSVRKVIHRDLKAENFLIKFDSNDNPIIKLIDFGLSTYIPKNDEKLYEIIGTTKYASPEMIKKTGYNEKTDEWAIGVVMFSMLTGYEPFRGTGPFNIKDSIVYDDVEFDYIKDNELRKLNGKFLDKNINTRINCKDALKILKKLKLKHINDELSKEKNKIFIDNYRKMIKSYNNIKSAQEA